MRRVFMLAFVFLTLPSYSQFLDFQIYTESDPYSEKELYLERESFSAYLHSVYKKYLSALDDNRCVYSPSCSNYALKAVKKYGFISAVPMVFDRVSRCNVHAARLYPKEPETGLALDSP